MASPEAPLKHYHLRLHKIVQLSEEVLKEYNEFSRHVINESQKQAHIP